VNPGHPEELRSRNSVDLANIEKLEAKDPNELTEEEIVELRRLPRLGPINKVKVTEVCFSVCLFFCLSVCQSIYLFVHRVFF
jgi:hypothetical protein